MLTRQWGGGGRKTEDAQRDNKTAAFMWPSPICLYFPLSLQKGFGFCAIKFEERICFFLTSRHLEGSEGPGRQLNGLLPFFS